MSGAEDSLIQERLSRRSRSIAGKDAQRRSTLSPKAPPSANSDVGDTCATSDASNMLSTPSLRSSRRQSRHAQSDETTHEKDDSGDVAQSKSTTSSKASSQSKTEVDIIRSTKPPSTSRDAEDVIQSTTRLSLRKKSHRQKSVAGDAFEGASSPSNLDKHDSRHAKRGVSDSQTTGSPGLDTQDSDDIGQSSKTLLTRSLSQKASRCAKSNAGDTSQSMSTLSRRSSDHAEKDAGDLQSTFTPSITSTHDASDVGILLKM